MLPPALPQADNAIGGPEHDGKEAEPDQQTEAVAIESDPDEEIQREGAQKDKNECADERTDRPRDAADDGDNQNVDGAPDADRSWRNLSVVPDLENSS